MSYVQCRFLKGQITFVCCVFPSSWIWATRTLRN